MGIREQIKQMESEEHILALIKDAQKYQYASMRTKRAWKSTAKHRIKQLNFSDSSQKDSTKVASSNKVSKNRSK